jgi:choline dehydrogenase
MNRSHGIESTEQEPPVSCDYLVIGGGSGGATAAGRLAAKSDARVVLLESGGTNQRPDVSNPKGWPELFESDANWGYETVPQRGSDDRAHVWPMGKVLGGSSSVNGMMYMRGAPWDFDVWAEMGNPEWGGEAVAAVFREIEDFPDGDPEIRGHGGPLRILRTDGENPLAAAFLSACAERGFSPVSDFNGADAEGYGRLQLNIAEGRRQDAAAAFLEPVYDRENLTVVTQATARRLEFAPGGNRVRSVEYRHGDATRRIEVEGEVLLAAGAIGSPQLLLLSGVGPADDLRGLAIDVAIDLPGVGDNLQDHVGCAVAFEARRPVPPGEYQMVETGIYCRTRPEAEHYDMQILMQQLPYVPPGFEGHAFENGFTFLPGILKPRSRGRLWLRSNDPADQPLIDPAYLTEKEDVESLMRAVEIARDLGSSPALAEWREREAVPGPEVGSGSDLEQFVRRTVSTLFHPVGTCRMGPGPECVVDSDLKVHGAENLRVLDASVMPEITSLNTNAPSMMIGWRAAEFITAGSGAASAATAGRQQAE